MSPTSLNNPLFSHHQQLQATHNFYHSDEIQAFIMNFGSICPCGIPHCSHPRALPPGMIPLTLDQAVAAMSSHHWTPPYGVPAAPPYGAPPAPPYGVPPARSGMSIRLPPSTSPLPARIAVRPRDIQSHLRSGASYYTGEYKTDFELDRPFRPPAPSIPTFTPTSRPSAPTITSSSGPQKTCSICQDDFPASQCARLLPCHHDDFCVRCVKAMVASNAATSRACPLCRDPFGSYHTKDGVVSVEPLVVGGVDYDMILRYLPPDTTFRMHWDQ